MTRSGLDQRRHPLGLRLAAAGVCLLAMSGCTRSRPATTPVAVALDVPPPPARVISTPPEPVVPTEAMTTDRPVPTARPARAARSSSRPDPARPTEPVRVEATTEVTPALPSPEPTVNTGPLLRTPQTADESNAEKRTREVLGRAVTLLDGVKTATLGQQARQQHETARRFVAQAQQAIAERNFVLASYLADKAETLARGLSQ